MKTKIFFIGIIFVNMSDYEFISHVRKINNFRGQVIVPTWQTRLMETPQAQPSAIDGVPTFPTLDMVTTMMVCSASILVQHIQFKNRVVKRQERMDRLIDAACSHVGHIHALCDEREFEIKKKYADGKN